MNKLLLLTVIALLCLHFGEGQRICMTCEGTIGNIPCLETRVTCNPGEVCSTTTKKVGELKFISKKCLEPSLCEKNETTSLGSHTLGTKAVSCCDEDSCNAGVGAIEFSLLAGLAALLSFSLVQIL
uniref:Prostate stem cell antigen-like n=1 Tax=Geotrypetes seraphini TaxID=260995 RepID=A0A6P8PCT4_GEOSA|nr:prostate stem cell antigen-like [Geotrypetes seraphini]